MLYRTVKKKVGNENILFQWKLPRLCFSFYIFGEIFIFARWKEMSLWKSCDWLKSHIYYSLFFLGPPPFGSSWVKRYCTFIKEQKILNMVTFDQRSGGKFVSRHRTQDENCDHLLGPQEFLRCFPSVFSGWDGVCHTQIMSSQNNWHAGPEVLLRPWHNWPVYTLFFFLHFNLVFVSLMIEMTHNSYPTYTWLMSDLDLDCLCRFIFNPVLSVL